MNFKEEAQKQVSDSLPHFNFDSDDFKSLENWNYLGYALLHAMNALGFAEKFLNDPAYEVLNQITIGQALFKDSIMSYCKCFSSSESLRVKIDINAVTKDLPDKESYRQTHVEILEIRNKFVAHNLENNFELSTIGAKQEGNKIILSSTITILTPTNDFDKFREQYMLVSNYVILKANKIADKICKEKGVTIEFQ